MIVASTAFFIFVPLVLFVYHTLGARRWKYGFLTLASWLFYAWASPGYLWVILLLTVIDYFAALKIEQLEAPKKRQAWLTLSVMANLGILGAFKYSMFLTDNALAVGNYFSGGHLSRSWELLLPLGVSYHTFQGISYTVDVYRKQIRAVRSFPDYALFVTFFPQLAAGPIVRAAEFLPQMVQPPRVNTALIQAGVLLFFQGLFKKLLIADQLDQLFVSPVFAEPGQYDAATLRWASIAWVVQIYCDFSGYTDMALGTAKLFGFELPQNFRYPFHALSITDFWRRWHLSLSTWLRDYLYFPLGGNRGSVLRVYCNLLFVFVLCGLWHGATWQWLAYGVYNGVLICAHRMYDRTVGPMAWRRHPLWLGLAWLATMLQLVLGLVLIRTPDWATGQLFFSGLVGLGQSASWLGTVPPLVFVLLGVGLLGHVLVLLEQPFAKWQVPHRLAVPLQGAYAGVLLLATLIFAPGVGKSFLYMAF